MDAPRVAGREPLSLALIDARHHTLQRIAAFDAAQGANPGSDAQDGAASPLWTLGHIGWFQEYWIARNVQRARGERADPTLPRLASILPDADRCFEPAREARAAPGPQAPPDLGTLKQYLLETLETTLDLLSGTPDDDDALYFYRLALFHEDRHGEALIEQAQAFGVDPGALPTPRLLAARAPLLFPATRFRLGAEPGGFVFDNEKWAHEIELPEFEIDAQVVSWAQYAEFVEDGGYDERGHWSDAGWDWVQGRRTPRYVDQMRHGVLQQRFGRLMRVAPNQPAMHLSGFEAEAWCRWAGRRLPGEAEWEAAAVQGATRGFRWGDAWEWTASTLRPYPGFVAGPDRAYSQPYFGQHRVLRGASPCTSARLRSARFRRFEAPACNAGFFGFRSCAA
jgi:ergothioneine biosynthesis protein EgtB